MDNLIYAIGWGLIVVLLFLDILFGRNRDGRRR
jgi:hypothetical protein